MDIKQLVGRQVHVRAIDLFGAAVFAVIRATESAAPALLLEFTSPVRIGEETYLFAVAKPRLERDDLGVLLNNGILGCGVTCVPRDSYDPTKPFDLSWWRGGGAAIADLVLSA